jgi:hypothetical protein
MVFTSILIAAGLSRLAPKAVSLYYQIQGGQILQSIERSWKLSEANDPYCIGIDNPSDEIKSNMLKTIAFLDKAATLDPGNHQTYLLLGNVYCLQGQPDLAFEAYYTYTVLSPNNPYGYLKMALAYSANCELPFQSKSPTGSSKLCTDMQMLTLVHQAWEKASVDPEDFFELGEKAFAAGDYVKGNRFYSYFTLNKSEYMNTANRVDGFRFAVASVVTSHTFSEPLLEQFPVYRSNKDDHIQGEDFMWLRSIPDYGIDYGSIVASYPRGDDRIAILNWTGTIVAFIETINPGTYQFSIRVQDRPPAPTLLQIEIDRQPNGPEIRLVRADDSLQIFTFNTVLDAGVHVLGINYLNNGLEGNQVQDGYVDWVKIKSVSSIPK